MLSITAPTTPLPAKSLPPPTIVHLLLLLAQSIHLTKK